MQNNQDIIKFTFLTEEQIVGYDQLDILNKYGITAAITDFSILLGGHVGEYCWTDEGKTLKDRAGSWWTKSIDPSEWYNGVRIARSSFIINTGSGWNRQYNARPALHYSEIKKNSFNRIKGNKGILEVEYGEYPQDIVPEDFSKTLEMEYLNRTINKTGKSYTTDSIEDWRKNTAFQARNHIEYEYNGKKYIRFVGDLNCSGKILSDGRTIQKGNAYWVEVKPIKWMIDEETGIALSKKLIFSGVQFSWKFSGKNTFNKSNIKLFMDKYFSKDIVPSTIKELNNEEKKEVIKTELELFYILPYTKNYDNGGYYHNNETESTDYMSPSLTIWRSKSLFFDDKEQLLNWFYKNNDKPIPIVYRIKYISNYKGIEDVIKLTNLSSNETKYHTMLNQDKCAYYDEEKSKSCDKDIWKQYHQCSSNEEFNLKDIYEELIKRGIEIKCDVDKTECFEFIGDPFYSPEKEEAKTKRLVLYKPSSKSCW